MTEPILSGATVRPAVTTGSAGIGLGASNAEVSVVLASFDSALPPDFSALASAMNVAGPKMVRLAAAAAVKASDAAAGVSLRRQGASSP